MREISNLELSVITAELQPLVGARLQKFYELAEGEFRAEFFLPGKGTRDLAVELKRRVAQRFVYILENESEYVVQSYENCFFRGSDLEFLEEESRAIVKTHFFASLGKKVTFPLVNAAAGMGEFLVTEGDARAFFVPLVLSLVDEKDEALAAAATRRVGEEYGLLSAQNRKSVASWIGRLQWSLQKEGRRPEAFERLEAALEALPA